MIMKHFVALTFAAGMVSGLGFPALAEVRSFDGSNNNLANSSWGAAGTPLRRILPAAYVDSLGEVLVGPPTRENPRVISNMIVAQPQPIPNSRGLTNYAWQWGQFLDHDIDLTEANATNGTAPVPLFPGDPLGPGSMPFSRSNFDSQTGVATGTPRQQVNQITSYIDASNVYGSDATRAAWLRTGIGGRLKTSSANLLPYNDGTVPNAGTPEQPDLSTELFVAGDIRSNEQVGLTAMHTVFVREHNRLCALLQNRLPGATDEQLYQTARRIVGAEIQRITYREFLPALLGTVTLPEYNGYRSDVNASIANEFSTAFFRFGHTMLIPEFTLVDPGGTAVGSLQLRDAFFNPHFFDDPQNVDRILGGLTALAQQIDPLVIDDVRNFLFGPPGAGGLDLATLNMQRGRDHGLPDYNSLRAAYGLLAKDRFLTDGSLGDGVTPNGVTTDPTLAQLLEAVYGSVDNIDPWLGGLAEDPRAGSPLSEIVGVALVEQYTRLRDGDRFFYLADPELQADEITAIIDLSTITLKDIIEMNTSVRFDVNNIFVIPEPMAAMAGWWICGMMALLRSRIQGDGNGPV